MKKALTEDRELWLQIHGFDTTAFAKLFQNQHNPICANPV